MTTAQEVLKLIKDDDVKYADFRFTDPRGMWQHVTFDISMIEEETFSEGQMFDGSSIAGWKAINESDMCLMPDPSSACIDPFFAETTLVLVCDVLEPTTGEPYNRDPRGIAKKAEAMVKSMGVGDTISFGPEAEFFVFDDVRYAAEPYNTGFKVDQLELPINSWTEYEGGNLGHRIRTKMGYFPVPPQDSVQDMRTEMLAAMAKMGVKVEKHHHEVASAQHELGMKFAPMVSMADQLQIYKYCIHQVANIYGKTACFMPKPIYGDNGSGMHCHQSIWKDGKPVFAGNKYADLSETCLAYIAGVIKHAKAINAFTNPTTNSYKRLVRTYTDKHGLKDLVRDLLGIDVSKQQQLSDWGAEELTDAQVAYAASDVLHLHALREKLDAMLAREGRTDLAAACFRFLPDRVRLDLAGWAAEDIFA
ncbi:MAG: type I glutamate--ammonia ligase, partial [Stellaceae bacterium]